MLPAATQLLKWYAALPKSCHKHETSALHSCSPRKEPHAMNTIANTYVRARIDPMTKLRASEALKEMG